MFCSYTTTTQGRVKVKLDVFLFTQTSRMPMSLNNFPVLNKNINLRSFCEAKSKQISDQVIVMCFKNCKFILEVRLFTSLCMTTNELDVECHFRSILPLPSPGLQTSWQCTLHNGSKRGKMPVELWSSHCLIQLGRKK